jgi:hypothetical protein
MKRIFAFLGKIDNLPVLILACVLFASFPFYFLPQHKVRTESYSADVGFVDLCFFPEPDKIYEIAEAYGKEGRSAAVTSWLTLDIIWPLVHSFFFLVCINFCIGYAHSKKGSLLSLAALLPLVFDYGENMLGIFIMTAYPARMNALALGMSAANGLKWISFAVVCSLFVYGLVALPVCFFLKRKK